jgi:hypothetical protein
VRKKEIEEIVIKRENAIIRIQVEEEIEKGAELEAEKEERTIAIADLLPHQRSEIRRENKKPVANITITAIAAMTELIQNRTHIALIGKIQGTSMRAIKAIARITEKFLANLTTEIMIL